VLGAVALVAFAVVAYAPAKPTNFRGFDEWVNVSLLSRNILDFPYANRPLCLLWGWPALRLFPDRLTGFLVFHVAWIALGGVLTFLITRRLLPGATALAFVAGALAIVWAPGDQSRICSVQMTLYSGCTFGALLATWLAVEAWSRRSPALAAGAALAGVVTILSFEATMVPLGLVPLLFLAGGGSREPRRLLVWTLAAGCLVFACALRFAAPRWTDPERVAYQGGIAADFTPGPLLDRTWRQLRRYVAPVVAPPPLERPWPFVPLSVGVFAVGFAVASRRSPERPEGQSPPRAALAAAAGLGLLWAVASLLPFVLNPETHGAERMQFIPTPGVAVLFAATAFVLASFLPARARLPAVLFLGGWIAASGVARVAALQVAWDEKSAYPDQRSSLLGITAVVPDVEPGTLVVLLGGGGWAIDVTFRQALFYLYEGRAVGHSVDALEYLYETRFESGGVRSSPRPVLEHAWQEASVLYRYDAVVVVKTVENGGVTLAETWPDELDPLPAGASYAPRARIRFGPRLPRLRILGREALARGAAPTASSSPSAGGVGAPMR
jgi:hypothetical protein